MPYYGNYNVSFARARVQVFQTIGKQDGEKQRKTLKDVR